jgi:DNA helicase II / ATP-dependent DNA helicase PcrA
VKDYLDELNEVQRQAVEQINGPALVIAGAGSGKTRVLTYRIAHVLRMGAKPSSILALTFTNKAAKEMRERIAQLVGEDTAKYLWMGTFHSIFAKILRTEAGLLGYKSSFTIYDADDAKSLVKKIVKDMNLDEKVYKPNDILHRISSAKNNLITPAAYQASAMLHEKDASSRVPETKNIYKTYNDRCYKSGVMDFDDLLLNTNILFKQFPEVLAKYQHRFKYILVDEYQDTNLSQYLIVKKLAEIHKNVCVVGDDAQSIYSFRGANIENILNFRNDYPDFKMFKLEQNYRSTQNIVNAANTVIAKNKRQIQKLVFSENETGEKIRMVESLSDTEEGVYVADSILESHLRDHYTYDEYAVLYRTNMQSRIMEEALRRRNIPYKIYGGLSFYQRKEIKDLLAYCRLVVNHSDDEAFKRIINYPKRGIGDTTVEKLETVAQQNSLSIWDTLFKVNVAELGLNKGTLGKIGEFVRMIDDFSKKASEVDAYELSTEIATSSGILKELYNEKTPEGIARHENVQELLNGIKEFTEQIDIEDFDSSLDKYLQDISLLTGQDNEKDDGIDKVTLMTIHSSKGLEFKNVYIVGMEEKLFPSFMSVNSQNELEEERRLFYVAVTRAKTNLSLTYSRQRYRWGNLEFCSPSRFLQEIDPQYVDTSRTSLADANEPAGKDFDDEDDTNWGNSSKPQFVKSQPKQANIPGRKATGFSGQPQQKPFQQPVSANGQRPLTKIGNRPAEQPAGDDNFVGDDTSGLRVGMKVEHPRFGFGTVVSMEGAYPNVKATINFDNAGQKNLLLRFAKLRLLA